MAGGSEKERQIMTNSSEGWGTTWPESFEVGYGKPPKHAQFKKGLSGNIRGRPKHVREDVEYLQGALEKTVPVTVGNIQKKMPRQEVMDENLVTQAIKGNLRAMRLVFEMMVAKGMSLNFRTMR
jgi:hypothetical protein